ncbi:Uncharacterized protein TCM_015965 [Theobroma cacao]|uniref:Endonuclease/exonuclease/phosphatase domain-containing protein n=1 Tax=Theobroma cacao TaxID=3641 RepID=A0A061G563_THECC|nr:Uncharacterized protein TCM_015965 [Theobroma cacao]
MGVIRRLLKPLLLLFISLMNLKVLVWNCQGAGDRGFPHFANDLQRIHNISIMILLEPRISGTNADKVIRSIKFDRSHKVEAIDFSGGF